MHMCVLQLPRHEVKHYVQMHENAAALKRAADNAEPSAIQKFAKEVRRVQGLPHVCV